MTDAVLRKGDGLKKQRPEYRDQVRKMQTALAKNGLQVDLDGLFGQGTEEALKIFQKSRGLTADGICGSNTWKALLAEKEKEAAVAQQSCLEGFCGDLEWVHKREGHNGRPYWPKGESGVTLDPGIDLGYADPDLIGNIYKDILSEDEMRTIKLAMGVKGEEARKLLEANAELRKIKISRDQANSIFEYAAEPYWQKIVKRFTSLADNDVLPSAQTAMLSLSYNRGPNNRGLEELGEFLDNKDWNGLHDAIGNMQQDHELEGIRKRRRQEAELIKTEIV